MNASVSLISLGLCLAVLEVATRLLMDVTDIAWYRPHPIVGYALEPHQTGHWKTDSFTGTYRINLQGHNNEHDYDHPRMPGKYRIAILGDSFVEALQVPRGTRFFDLLEQELSRAGLPAEVYTFAASSYGTGQELLLLEHEVLPYRPDVVVVLFVPNDLADSACVLGQASPKPCFTIDSEGRPVAHVKPPHRPNRMARLIMRSALARYILVQRRLVDRIRSARRAAADGQGPGAALDTETDEAWSVVEGCLRGMVELSRAAGTQLLLVNQPVPPGGDNAPADGPGSAAHFAEVAGRLEAIAGRVGAHLFRLDSAFNEAAVSGWGPFVLEDDGHWTTEGHAVAAHALVTPLAELLRRSTSVGRNPLDTP